MLTLNNLTINNFLHIVVLVIMKKPFSIFIMNECSHLPLQVKKKFSCIFKDFNKDLG